MNDDVMIYDVEGALEVLRKYFATPPDCCGDCYFMVKTSTSDPFSGGYCKLEIVFDVYSNWHDVASYDVRCTSLTFLKKLLERL